MFSHLSERGMFPHVKQALIPSDDLDVIDIEPTDDTARHVLLDSAGGRFEIDPDTGTITLSDPGLLERECGAVHQVRVRSQHDFGAYEALFHLRISGRIPEAVLPDGSDPLALHGAYAPQLDAWAREDAAL